MTGGVLFDGHLDLAWNAQLGRDLTLDLSALRAQDPVAGQTAGVSFPELRRAGVAACFGTLFACPASDDYPQGYEQDGRDDWKGARRQALWQLDQYRRWQDDGLVRLLTTAGEVSAHLRDWDAGAPGPLGVVLLMEGADPHAERGRPGLLGAGGRAAGGSGVGADAVRGRDGRAGAAHGAGRGIADCDARVGRDAGRVAPGRRGGGRRRCVCSRRWWRRTRTVARSCRATGTCRTGWRARWWSGAA